MTAAQAMSPAAPASSSVERTPMEAWIVRRVAADADLDPGIPVSRDGDRRAPAALSFDRAALEAYQLRRLRATLDLVRSRSRLYRHRLAGAPAELASLEDIRRLPFTTAADLRTDPLALVCVSQGEIGRVVTLDSSGTTGAPKRLYFTPADQALTIDFFAVGMSVYTHPGDRVLILLPGETPGSVGDLLAMAMERLGAVPIKHGPVRDPEATLRIAVEAGATVAVGVPTHLLRLVRDAPAGLVPSLHSVLLSTDHVPSAIVRAVEAAWGCDVYNHYGMTETGLGGGVDCRARRGYHLREADLLFELVDPDGGEAVPDGDEGEVVLTTLTRTGMPLIRYRTGDLARWLPDPCPCGTGLRTLSHVTTRVDGPVRLGTGPRLAQPDLDEAVFAVDGVLDFATTAATTDGATSVALRVQVSRSHDPASVREQVIAALRGVPAIRLAAMRGDLAALDVAVGSDRVSGLNLAKRRIERA
jgi:phenylacetate-CoA ligase